MDINGIKIDIKRRRIKNLHIYVRPPEGSVLVTAPYGYSEQRIGAFIMERLDWIEKSQRQVIERGRKREQLRDRAMSELVSRYGSKAGMLTDKELQNILSERIARILPGLCERTGLRAEKISIRSMKSRWGSCTPGTGAIRINLELVFYPDSCLEYILLHELAHTRVPNHGRDFYAILDRHMPDWRARRRMLRL